VRGGRKSLQVTHSSNDMKAAPERSVGSISMKGRDNFLVTELVVLLVE
jgi:hypothetical protein